MRHVVPVGPVGTVSWSLPPSNATTYELYATRPLPTIDTTRNVKHVVFSSSSLSRFNLLTHIGRHWFGPAYLIGFIMGCVVLFVPLDSLDLRGWLASVSSLLQLVPTLIAFLVLRYDMVVLLVKTYEFWYMSCMNTLICVCIALSLGDARWPLVLSVAVSFEVALLIDANFRKTGVIVAATVLGAVLNNSYIVSATFGYVETGNSLRLFSYNGHTFHIDDAASNVLGTLMLLLVRNAYRKHEATRAHAKRPRGTVQCITYRCHIGIRPVTLPIKPDADPSVNLPTGVAQLRFVSTDQILDAANVLIPFLVRRLSGCPLLLPVCAIISLILIVTTVVVTNTSVTSVTASTSVAFATVVVFCFISFAQRKLLRRLLTSFDFLFLSAQMTLTHACVADIVQWTDPRALGVFASWLLTHWVLLHDAVLPNQKSIRLGYHRGVASAVIVIYLISQFVIVASVIVASDLDTPELRLRDRILFTLAFHHRIKHVRAVPLLLGRTLATLSWSLRLLWRLSDCRSHELLLLQGRVEFTSHPVSSSVAVGSTE